MACKVHGIARRAERTRQSFVARTIVRDLHQCIFDFLQRHQYGPFVGDVGALAHGILHVDLRTQSSGVEYRRSVVPDQGVGGRSLDVGIVAAAPTGTWRVAAFTDPKRPAIGEATFLVEDYVPDRLGFDISTTATSIAPSEPAEIALDGRFL